MSFVKKALKKAWNFVKDNWKTIALVAAIAFTAGVATVGFAAFSGVSSVGGFFSAVGSTMWAGVAGTAGSLSIGSGATVPAGSALAAQGVTHVGLGAAAGAGGGFGLGAAGKAAALQAAAHTAAMGATEAAAAANATNIIGSQGTGIGVGTGANPANTAMMPGMTADSASVASGEVAKTTVASGEVGKATAAEVIKDTTVKEVASKGLSDAAWKTMGVIAPIAGAGLMAAGQPSEFKNVDYWGTTKGGPIGPGVNALADPTGASADGTFDPGGTGAASTGADPNAMMRSQVDRSYASIAQPLMGSSRAKRGRDGMLEDDWALMDMQGQYRYG
jgi:hypothetical protein